MKYEELAFASKVNCIREYITAICPYDDYSDWTFEDMEYNIEEILAKGYYKIDKAGWWYDEEGRLI